MKYHLSVLSIVALLAATALGFAKNEKIAVPGAIRSELNSVVGNYLQLKDALVGTDAKMAGDKARNLATAVTSVKSNLMTEESAKAWAELSSEIIHQVTAIQASSDVAKQRAAFSELSKAVEETVRQFGPLNETLYRQHCPMAFNNKGADWLSDSKEIMNPYFGKMMLHCGSVEATYTGTADQSK